TSNTANYTGAFLGMQYFIDLALIEYSTNVPMNDLSNVHLDHLGCPAYYDDQLNSVYNFFVPIFISTIYMITFIMNVGYIVEERHTKTKEYLRIFGLRSWINNLVWVCRSMCFYLVLSALITGLANVVLPSSGTRFNSVSKALFNNTHWTVILTILF
ncbi:unnamed protein product, partial [Didymodactylos carnosus]